MSKQLGTYDYKDPGELTVTITLREYRDLLHEVESLRVRLREALTSRRPISYDDIEEV